MPKNLKFGGLDLPKEFLTEDAKIVILSVPFDKTASWIKGSSEGPRAILKASDYLEWMDLESGAEIYKLGIFTAPEIEADSSEIMVKSVYEETKKHLADGKFIVTLGGEHSISLGTIKAHLEKFPSASVLHLDAHSDRRDSYQGNALSHASIMARVNDLTKNITSVGIRSMAEEEKKLASQNKIILADYIRKSPQWIEETAASLKDDVYVTIDLDVFDPGIMPAVGTPEPGGLGWYQVVDLLKNVSREKNIIGLDVVELSPIANLNHPDFLAAKLVYQILSYIFA
jgi:agmatinase